MRFLSFVAIGAGLVLGIYIGSLMLAPGIGTAVSAINAKGYPTLNDDLGSLQIYGTIQSIDAQARTVVIRTLDPYDGVSPLFIRTSFEDTAGWALSAEGVLIGETAQGAKPIRAGFVGRFIVARTEGTLRFAGPPFEKTGATVPRNVQ